MKLEAIYSDQEVETLDAQKTIKFGFDKNAQQMIFSMFSRNIYSNPIGSVVREITSNCFDSHVEANVSDPVILKLTNENNQHYISFIDVGVGISPERMATQYASGFFLNKTK
jgi:sensor histidine kinase regulating citrate/malate metabolism